jgi:drug/metabolite transporter (DMT)-like permease
MLIGLLTFFTLLAFAGNSLLCRMALGNDLIDPTTFTALRLASGALILVPVSQLLTKKPPIRREEGSWASGLALFAYAITFSLAYVSLDTGMGALILFGSVQVTMICAGLKSGERPHPLQWMGLAAALGGLVYLVLPGIKAPDPIGSFLMLVSGLAWGVYSIRGKGVTTPIPSTAGNFMRSVPMAVVAGATALIVTHPYARQTGVALALVSGTVTSGFGYVLWYKVLKSLTTTQAAVVQLLVPVLAAFGGVILLAEQLSVRLLISGALILGGVAMAVLISSRQITPDQSRQ